MSPIYWSDRDLLLCLSTPPSRPTITCELYIKWYCLYVVYPDNTVTRLEFEDLIQPENSNTYVDHAPNPAAVELLADVKGWIIDDLALDLITGRWVNEAKDRPWGES